MIIEATAKWELDKEFHSPYLGHFDLSFQSEGEAAQAMDHLRRVWHWKYPSASDCPWQFKYNQPNVLTWAGFTNAEVSRVKSHFARFQIQPACTCSKCLQGGNFDFDSASLSGHAFTILFNLNHPNQLPLL